MVIDVCPTATVFKILTSVQEVLLLLLSVKTVDQIVLSGTAARDHCKLSHWKSMGLHICN